MNNMNNVSTTDQLLLLAVCEVEQETQKLSEEIRKTAQAVSTLRFKTMETYIKDLTERLVFLKHKKMEYLSLKNKFQSDAWNQIVDNFVSEIDYLSQDLERKIKECKNRLNEVKMQEEIETITRAYKQEHQELEYKKNGFIATNVILFLAGLLFACFSGDHPVYLFVGGLFWLLAAYTISGITETSSEIEKNENEQDRMIKRIELRYKEKSSAADEISYEYKYINTSAADEISKDDNEKLNDVLEENPDEWESLL